MSLKDRYLAWKMQVPYSHLASVLDPARDIHEEEHQRRFTNASYALYWQAVRVREMGISWRGFTVGSAAWAFRDDASTIADRFRWFYGMNTKPEETGRNICAEPISLNAALAANYTRVVGLLVIGRTQKDEHGVEHVTLRPCKHCRALMKHHPLVRHDTVIICAQPPDPEKPPAENWSEIVHERFTFAELLAEYGELEGYEKNEVRTL